MTPYKKETSNMDLHLCCPGDRALSWMKQRFLSSYTIRFKSCLYHLPTVIKNFTLSIPATGDNKNYFLLFLCGSEDVRYMQVLVEGRFLLVSFDELLFCNRPRSSPL